MHCYQHGKSCITLNQKLLHFDIQSILKNLEFRWVICVIESVLLYNVCAFSVIISFGNDEGIKNAAKNMYCFVFFVCS